jgi:hypothetical protein
MLGYLDFEKLSFWTPDGVLQVAGSCLVSTVAAGATGVGFAGGCGVGGAGGVGAGKLGPGDGVGVGTGVGSGTGVGAG